MDMRQKLRYGLALLMFFAAQAAWAYAPRDCINCHKIGSTESNLQISIAEYKASIHGEEAECQDCHYLVKDDSHTTTPGSGATNCSSCHEQENHHGWGSNSGTRPQCYSCHTRHAMLPRDDPRSSTHSGKMQQTCRSCHPRECGLTDYWSWLPSLQIASHSKQDFSRAYDRANCLGCHQGKASHGRKETVDDQICFTCHLTPDGNSKLLDHIHVKADPQGQPGVTAAAVIYQVVLGVLVLGGIAFFIHKFSVNTNRGSDKRADSF